MKNLKILSRLKEKKEKNLEKIKNDFFVFDVETYTDYARPEGFAFCCMVGNGYRKFFASISEFTAELFSGYFKDKYIFAHNGGAFDYNVIFDNIYTGLSEKAIFNGSAFIFAEKEKVLFCDSLNIYKASVEKLGAIVGLEKTMTYERFGKNEIFEYTSDEIERCYRDCDIVWFALEKIFLQVQSVRPTLASLSMIYYRRFFQPFDIAYNNLSNRFFDSYTGGRVEAIKIGATHSQKIDANSMYPYVMSWAVFPNPKFLKVSDSADKDGLLSDLEFFEGQAAIEVYHRPTEFGYLPVKHEKTGKLEFNCGYIKGTWCFPEIRYALQRKAIEILKVNEVIISYPMVSPFKRFAIELYDKRQTFSGIENYNTKIILNSLYGKFAQHQKDTEIYYKKIPWDLIDALKPEQYDLIMFNKDREDCYLKIYSPVKVEKIKKGYLITLSNGFKMKITDNKFYSKKDLENLIRSPKIHTIPVFSSYITSLARVYLLKNMYKNFRYGVTYCDTDSICLEKPIKLNNTSVLGEFKLEKEIITEIRGNKNYTQINEKGILEEKIKGIPKKATLVGVNKYEYINLIKTKKAIRHQLKAGDKELINKLVAGKYDKRILNVKTGKTKAKFINK